MIKAAATVQVRLTQDIPGDGYYHSALKAFVTRTCYANSSGAGHCWQGCMWTMILQS